MSVGAADGVVGSGGPMAMGIGGGGGGWSNTFAAASRGLATMDATAGGMYDP